MLMLTDVEHNSSIFERSEDQKLASDCIVFRLDGVDPGATHFFKAEKTNQVSTIYTQTE